MALTKAGPAGTTGARDLRIGIVEDTEGHIILGDNPVEDEDVEAHVQPPRDTDLGNSPR